MTWKTIVDRAHDVKLRLVAKPYHYDPADAYCCGCTGCEDWRGARVWPGRLCRPATRDPSKAMPGTVSAWPLDRWSCTGWSFRLEDRKIFLVMVVGYVDPNDEANGGHLDCVVVLTCEPEPRLFVTSRKWLAVIA